MKLFKIILKSLIIIFIFTQISKGNFPPSNSNGPCSTDYWDEINSFRDFGYPSNNYPLQPTPTPTNMITLSKSGTLLIHDPNGYQELVFLKGVGEYYEFINKSILPKPNYYNYFSIFNNLNLNKINMIRIFLWNIGKYPDQSKFYIFNFNNITGKYQLHYYNENTFEKLREFIKAAYDNKTFVLISLFDFSVEIRNENEWKNSAWNTDNNDHYNVIHYKDFEDVEDFIECPDTSNFIPNCSFFLIFEYDANGNAITDEHGNYVLNNLGITQRDFVLKVVNKTRSFYNVIYNITSESI